MASIENERTHPAFHKKMLANEYTRMKTPSSKRPSSREISNTKHQSHQPLELEVWSFSGAWTLGRLELSPGAWSFLP
ncbi:MAG TPA: hypothetical protein VGF90_01115 [Verrucomicrobiae bacterium]|jgi:hypothetical protein